MAITASQAVILGAAVQRVIAGAAIQGVLTGPANSRIVARPAIDQILILTAKQIVPGGIAAINGIAAGAAIGGVARAGVAIGGDAKAGVDRDAFSQDQIIASVAVDRVEPRATVQGVIVIAPE